MRGDRQLTQVEHNYEITWQPAEHENEQPRNGEASEIQVEIVENNG